MAEGPTFDKVRAGEHACLTFTDAEERLDLVASFVRDGLRGGWKVVCWTETHSPDDLAAELAARSVRAKAAIGRGQLLIEPASTSLAGGSSSAATMVDVLSAKLESADRDGYVGLRVTTDMAWAAHPQAEADELLSFETKVADLFTASSRLCLICQYDRDRFDPVTLAYVAKVHVTTVAGLVYYEHPLLRICRQYSPPGVRIAGDLDYRHEDVLAQALGESMRLDRRMHVNLSQLGYIDGACAAMIVATAARLAPSRRMMVTCRRVVAKVLEIVGAPTVPQLSLQVVDVR